MKDFEAVTADRRVRGLYRKREVLDSPQGVEVRIGDERLLSFCSNDYLGLANHPEVITALQHGAARYGVGAGASHFVSGHSRAHHLLEEELADFLGWERAVVFSNGYMANLGALSALTSKETRIYSDELNHASLIDGARLTRCEITRYRHTDHLHLQTLLSTEDKDQLIVSDGVFSMDGDVAPLPALATLASQAHALLVIDDAHGIGVLGEGGRGIFETAGIPVGANQILIGTLGKALGTAGAFVVGSGALIEALLQTARTYIYTTALPPALAEASRTSLRIARTESWRRDRLHKLVIRFRHHAAQMGLPLLPSETPIQPLLLGTAERATWVAKLLRDRGILVPAIRPPTVPEGYARLRITFSSAHEESHVDRLLDALISANIKNEYAE